MENLKEKLIIDETFDESLQSESISISTNTTSVKYSSSELNCEAESQSSSVLELLEEKIEDSDTKEKQITLSEEIVPIMTLLQKAMHYRDRNQEKWKNQQEKQQQKLRASFCNFDKDLFLEEFYKELDKIKKESKKLEELRKLELSKLILQVEYNLPWNTTNKDESETYESLSALDLSVYDKDGGIFDRLKSDRHEERGHVPELLITVKKGKYLLNHMDKNQEHYEQARVICKFLSKLEKSESKMKSAYCYLDSKGTSRWDHAFVVKGYSANDLARKYLLLQVVGKSGNQKHIIGEAILAGSEVLKVKYQQSKQSREPHAEEIEIFKKTLETPGTVSTHTVDLFREGIDRSALAAKMEMARNQS